MTFKEYLRDFNWFNNSSGYSDMDIRRILDKNKIQPKDFLALLSEEATNRLEEMAIKANQLTVQHFGKGIILYTPLYISNICINKCIYCSFSKDHPIPRRTLTLEEIEAEGKAIAKTGLRHILLLTGESREATPIPYIIKVVKLLKKYFSSIAIEIFPLLEQEYSQLIQAGIDGLTIYQEVYDREIYEKVHVAGPKKNYDFRLEAPERACRAGIRWVNIGPLLGLNDWRREAFYGGLHASYLQDKFPDVEVSISLPRLRPFEGNEYQGLEISNRNLVQTILALRIFLPRVGITISTREPQALRDKLIPLGVTKMSAGVSTIVGGHTTEEGPAQFQIEDKRTVEEIKAALVKRGYKPILQDWMHI